MDIMPYIHQRYCSLDKKHGGNHRVTIQCGGVHRALGEGFEVLDEQTEDQKDREGKEDLL